MSLIATDFMCAGESTDISDDGDSLEKKVPCDDGTVIEGFRGEEYFCKTCGKLMIPIPGIGIKTWKNGLGKSGML